MSAPGCEAYRELISAFADERLEGTDLLRLEEHLEACAACRIFDVELRRLRELLRAAEAFRPVRRPPPGFATAVVARLAREAPAPVVSFPGVRDVRRPAAAWLGFAAAAAVTALFFAWSWQRLVPGDVSARRVAATAASVAVVAAAGDEGSMDDWLRRHATLARDATILGQAEEVEFTGFRSAATEER